MERPWIKLGFAFWLGLCLKEWAWAGGLIALVFVVFLGSWTRKTGNSCWALIAFSLASGMVSAAFDAADDAPPAIGHRVMGRVVEAELSGGHLNLVVAPDGVKNALIWVSSVAYQPGLAVGARLLVNRPHLLSSQENPGGFDFKEWGRRRSILWQAHGPVLLLEPAGQGALRLLSLRKWARDALDELDGWYGAAVLKGLLLGDKKSLPQSAERALKSTGLAHLLAVSGLHVAGFALALFGAFSKLFCRLGVMFPKRWSAVAALPCVWGFVALAQFPVSACRAGVMVTGLLLSNCFLKPSNGKNLFGFAAFMVIAHQHGAPFEVSFQLSFAAVGALLWCGGRFKKGLVSVLWTCLVAWAATAPIQAYHFGTFAPMSLAANLVLTPVASGVLVPLGLLALFASPLTSMPLNWAAKGAELLVAFAEALLDLGWDQQIVGRRWAFALAIPICLMTGVCLRQKKFAILISCAFFVWSAASGFKGVAVEAIAVGQGDALLVRSDDRSILVDAGPDFEAKALLAYLRHEGIGHLDAVFISHGHSDHYGGLMAVLKEVEVDRFFVNGRVSPEPAWQKTLEAIQKTKKPIEIAEPGKWQMGEVQIEVLSHVLDASWGENDASIVMKIVGPGCDLLLTGDITEKKENDLQNRGLLGNICVLKAPHHGSRGSNSEAFLEALKPKAIVLTAGRYNSFGLPSPYALKRYQDRKIPLWRTDLDGWIRVSLSDELRIQSMGRDEILLP